MQSNCPAEIDLDGNMVVVTEEGGCTFKYGYWINIDDCKYVGRTETKVYIDIGKDTDKLNDFISLVCQRMSSVMGSSVKCKAFSDMIEFPLTGHKIEALQPGHSVNISLEWLSSQLTDSFLEPHFTLNEITPLNPGLMTIVDEPPLFFTITAGWN